MIKATTTGYLGGDAQIKTIGGREYVALSLATNGREKDVAGQWQDVTQWIEVLWGNTSSGLVQYLKRGTAILAHGTLRSSVYIDKNGCYPRIGMTLWADYVELSQGNKKTEE